MQYCFELLRNAYRENTTNAYETVEKRNVTRETIDNSETPWIPCTSEANPKNTPTNCNYIDQNIKLKNKPFQSKIKSNQPECNVIFKSFQSPTLKSLLPSPEDRFIFEKYLSNPKNRSEIESYYQMLGKKYECAKIVATTIEECQHNILKIRQRMETLGGDYRNLQEVNDLNCQLMFYQNIYRETILQLEKLKSEIEHLKHGLKQTEIKIVRKFKAEFFDKTPETKSDLSCEDKVFDVLKTAKVNDIWNNSYEKNTQESNFSSMTSWMYPQIYESVTNSKGGYSFTDVSNPITLHSKKSINIMDSINSTDQKLNWVPKPNMTSNDFKPRDNILVSSDSSLCITNYISDNSKLYTFQIDNSFGKSCQKITNCPRKEFNQNIPGSSMMTNDRFEKVDTQTMNNYNILPNDGGNFSNMKIRSEDVDKLKTDTNCQPVKDCEHSQEFLDFMKTVPLTGDPDVDDEIYTFYRSKFKANVS